MKKLDLVQMENLQASGPNRDCMIVGGLTLAGTVVGALASWPAGGLAGAGALIGGLMTGASMGCFSR